MLKRIALLLSLLLVGALILTACGGEDPTATPEPEPVEEPAEEPVEEPAEEPTEEPVEEPTEEPAEEPTEEPVEEAAVEPDINITIWADETRAPILQELAPGFLDTYGVGLVIEQVPFGNMRDEFTIAAPAGEGPDIFIGAHDWIGSLIDSGLLAQVDLGDKADQFTDVAKTGFTFDGDLYGMPYAVENLAFVRNSELVPEAPATWDEVIEIGTALIDSGDVTYGFGVSGTTYDAYPFYTSFGGYIFGQDENGNWNPDDLGVDGEGMIAAGDWMAEQVASGFMSDNNDWDTAHQLFETGEMPFLMAGPWALDRLRESGVPYAISTFPDSGQPFGGVQAFMINALSDNVLLAQAFLQEFVATDEVMNQLFEAGLRPPAWIPTLDIIEDPDLLAFAEAGSNASLMPSIPEMGAVWGSWEAAFQLILAGEQAPADALATAGAQIREVTGGAFAGMVNVPGSYQAAAGCEGDWDPACEVTAMTEGDDGLFTSSHDLPAGAYEGKVALNGSWTTNYGVDGALDGDNYPFELTADGTVSFSYDPESHILTITIE